MPNIHKTIFSCERDGLTICGTEYRPEGTNLPAVIISHGFLANQKTVEKYAKQFAIWGYAAYCFDFIGGGLKTKSDGKLEDMTVFTELEDLKAVIAYVKSLLYIDHMRLILMGCSQGGFVSALTAAEMPEQVSALILFYPALCIPDDAGTFAEISGYQGPVLIIHGTEDEIVDISYAQRAWEVYQRIGENTGGIPRRDVQLMQIEGACHGFNRKYDQSAMFAVREFLHGRTEVITVDVTLTGRTVTKKDGKKLLTLPFEGTSKSPYFEGVILPGAADVQELKGLKPVSGCASYILEGTDYTGTACRITIDNIFDGNTWTPIVTTDSKALDFLIGAKCHAYPEGRKMGPLVRIYTRCPVPKEGQKCI